MMDGCRVNIQPISHSSTKSKTGEKCVQSCKGGHEKMDSNFTLQAKRAIIQLYSCG
jgi:hypothetical protein